MAKNADELNNSPAAKKKIKAARPIWEIAVELGRDIPEEDLKKLPGAKYVDEYLYGKPRPCSCD